MPAIKTYSLPWRGIFGVFLTVALGLASGPFMVTSGFGIFRFLNNFVLGGFVLWFIYLLVCFVSVSLVTDRWHYFLTPLSSLVMSGSLGYQNYLFLQKFGHSHNAWSYMKKDIEFYIDMALFALVVSVLVAYVVRKIRKA